MLSRLAVVSCAAAASAVALGITWAPSGEKNGTPPSLAAARIGDRTLTLAELDEEWERGDPDEHKAVLQQMYEGRRNAFDRLLGAGLIEDAARARGVSPAEFIGREVQRRARPVGEREVQAFYRANVERLNGAPLNELEHSIRSALEQKNRESAIATLVAELRQAGPAVRLLIDPPARTVPVTDHDPVRGDRHAQVTIVTFSDFQCPFCARLEPVLETVRATYGDSVRIVWKDFPLQSIHPESFKAAEASHCAAEQGRYWEFHDRLFAHQQKMDIDALRAHATALGLDTVQFSSCLDSSRYASAVQESLESGVSIGVQATPTVFVNGRVLSGAPSIDEFTSVIDKEFERAGATSQRTPGISPAQSY